MKLEGFKKAFDEQLNAMSDQEVIEVFRKIGCEIIIENMDEDDLDDYGLELECKARREAQIASAKALEEHARFTIKTLERFLGNRGWTTGKKLWEKKLLLSAYDALSIPDAERQFKLEKGKPVNYSYND